MVDLWLKQYGQTNWNALEVTKTPWIFNVLDSNERHTRVFEVAMANTLVVLTISVNNTDKAARIWPTVHGY